MIPKIIHFCWLSGNPYPPKIEQCILSWKEKLPDYEIILWDTKRFDINSVQWVKEAFDKKKYAFAADYIRFYALFNHGGIYLDSDVEVLKSFNDLLDCRSFIGFEYSGVLEAAIVGAEKKCCWIGNCLDWYNNRSFYDKDGKTKEIVLPMIISHIYEEVFDCELIDKDEVYNFNKHFLYPYKYFSPKDCYTNQIIQSDLSVAIHHFETAWQKKTLSIKIKKVIHIILIKTLGKKVHDLLLYKIRSKRLEG
ncbi:glycosyl transferase [Spirochaetia bacterium]|nr:glycosyl transferase [Spirochaetia bacterium]